MTAKGDFRRLFRFLVISREYGPDHPEVGDCYNLLARTSLSAGDVQTALSSAREAKRLIVDGDSKDYLDLCILEGDLWAAGGKYGKAIAKFDDVIQVASVGNYQISEIVARAHHQKGLVLGRMQRTRDAERESHLRRRSGPTMARRTPLRRRSGKELWLVVS